MTNNDEAAMLANHEREYEALFGKPCDDPDCEFHHPEVREF
jgi:hypothetical protein